MEDNNLQLTNTFEGGMNTDVSDIMIKNNEYRYAENIRIVTNTDSNTGEARLIEGAAEIPMYLDEKLFTLNIDEHIFAFTECNGYNIMFTKELYDKRSKKLSKSIDNIPSGQCDNYTIKAIFLPQLQENGADFLLESSKAGVHVLPENVDIKIKCDYYASENDLNNNIVTTGFVLIHLQKGEVSTNSSILKYFYKEDFQTLYTYCNIKEIKDVIIITNNIQNNYKLKFYKREDSSNPNNDMLLYDGNINIPIDPDSEDVEFDGYVWNVYRINNVDDVDGSRKIYKIFGPCKTKMWEKNGEDYKLSFEYFLDKNKKLYFADGHHLLMNLDVMKYNGDDIKQIQQFGYSGTLYAPDIDLNLLGGNLKAGVVLYSYQCYNDAETVTNVSPISGPLEIYSNMTLYLTNGQITSGNTENSNTSASVSIKINVKDVSYDNIILYRIHYIQNGLPPLVDLIYDGAITKSGIFFNFTDTGSKITSYNLEYLQSKISNFSLIPKLICSKNNYLFVANTKIAQDELYEDWNVLENVELSLTYRPDGDCIISKIHDYDSILQQENLARYKSLKDGETYRYGIVLYSNSGLVSATKWIADVTPDEEREYKINNESNIFYEKTIGNNISTMAKPIGIHVEVKNLPKSCIGYEIVRCVRTLNDTRCIAQGVISNTLLTNPKLNKLTDARFSQQPFISLAHNRFGNIHIGTYKSGILNIPRIAFRTNAFSSQKLIQFVSPEISYNGKQIYDIIKNNQVFLKIKRVYSSNTLKSGKLSFGHYSEGGDKYYHMDGHSFNTSGKYPFLWYDSFTYELKYNNDDSTTDDYSDTEGNGCCYFLNNDNSAFSSSNGVNDYVQTVPDLNVSYFEQFDMANGWYDNGYIFNHLRKIYYDVNKKRFDTHTDSLNDVFHVTLMPSKFGVVEDERCRNLKININNIKLVEPYDMRELFKDDTNNAQDRLHDISVGNYVYSPLVLCGIDVVNNNNIRHIDQLKNNGDVYKYGSFGNVLGLGCPGLIVSIDDNSPIYRNTLGNIYNSTTTDPICSSVTYVCNIEKECTPYGGNKNVNGSIYVSTGNFFDRGLTIVDIFDGDTYLQIYEHCNCHQYYNKDRNQMNKYMIYYHIPLESDINLALTHGEKISKDYIEGKYKYQYIQLKPNEVKDDDGTFVQTEPMYQYNFTYSTKQSSVKSSGIDSKTAMYGSKNYTNRIYYSNQKISDNIEDLWYQFKSANFLDVDNKYGEITSVYNFNNNLYFWQEHAFGVLSVNEKQLISNNNGTSLLLGTGDILQRYDYLSYIFGMKKDTDTKVYGNQILYWFDIDRRSLLWFNGNNVLNLFDIKNIQNLINESNFDNYEQKCIYDLKNKEVMLGGVNGKTLSFSEKINNFTSIYNLYFIFGNRIKEDVFLTSYRKLYRWNDYRNVMNAMSFKSKLNTIDSFIKIYPSIKYIINNAPQYTKVYDNVLFDVKDLNMVIFDGNGNSYMAIDYLKDNLKFYFKTVTGYGVSNKDDITNRELDYKLAIPRSMNAEYGSRLRGKTMLCEVKSDSNLPYFSLRYITTKYRISWN